MMMAVRLNKKGGFCLGVVKERKGGVNHWNRMQGMGKKQWSRDDRAVT